MDKQTCKDDMKKLIEMYGNENERGRAAIARKLLSMGIDFRRLPFFLRIEDDAELVELIKAWPEYIAEKNERGRWEVIMRSCKGPEV